MWRKDFCEKLVNQGLRVIRYDNRDVGLSSKVTGEHTGAPLLPRMVRSFLGPAQPGGLHARGCGRRRRRAARPSGIDTAHIVGASMGGMIAQVFAARHQVRTKTLAVIFSSNNQPLLPPPAPKHLLAILQRPKDATREAIIENAIRVSRIIGSPGYPAPEDRIRAEAVEGYDRAYYPAGIGRHFAAILGSGSLLRYDRQITAPTVVMHGKADKLMRPFGGRAIAQGHQGRAVGAVRRHGPRVARASCGTTSSAS